MSYEDDEEEERRRLEEEEEEERERAEQATLLGCMYLVADDNGWLD